MLCVIVTVAAFLEQFHCAFALNDRAELGLVGLGDLRKSCPVVNHVQVFEGFCCIAVLVVCLCEIEISLGKTEQRRFEPETAAGMVIELGTFPDSSSATYGVREHILLVLVGRITSSAPSCIRPVIVARIVLRIKAAELDVGMGSRLRLGDIGPPVRAGFRSSIPDLRPVYIIAFIIPILLEMVCKDSALGRIEMVVGLIVGTVDKVDKSVSPAIVIELVSKYQLFVRRFGGSASIVVECVWIRLSDSGIAGIY